MDIFAAAFAASMAPMALTAWCVLRLTLGQ